MTYLDCHYYLDVVTGPAADTHRWLKEVKNIWNTTGGDGGGIMKALAAAEVLPCPNRSAGR